MRPLKGQYRQEPENDQHEEGMNRRLIAAASVIALAMLLFGAWGIKVLMERDTGAKPNMHRVRLLNVPPPKIIEKPPEPKLEEIKKEEVKLPEPEQKIAADQPPPGDQLGLDAEGQAGTDAFGMSARPGGRDLLLGTGDGLMQKYGWYVRLLEEEIGRQMVKKAKLPGGGLQVFVRIVLDGEGGIVSHVIYGSSGNPQVDGAVDQALKLVKQVSEPPPDGMPRMLKLRITVPA